MSSQWPACRPPCDLLELKFRSCTHARTLSCIHPFTMFAGIVCRYRSKKDASIQVFPPTYVRLTGPDHASSHWRHSSIFNSRLSRRMRASQIPFSFRDNPNSTRRSGSKSRERDKIKAMARHKRIRTAFEMQSLGGQARADKLSRKRRREIASHGGKVGGKARAQSLSPERRREIAAAAGRAGGRGRGKKK